MKTVQVCLEYVPSIGGSVITVKDYVEALGSEVIAFTSVNNIDRTQGWDKGVWRVPIRSDFIGRQYGLPGSKSLLKAAESILGKSDLAVIHLLYRYHVQWASAALGKAKIPYWIIPNGSLDPWVFTYRKLQKRIWLQTIGRKVLRRAEAVIFATERERQKALPYLEGCKTRVIHWPVEYVDTSRRDQARLEVRASHSIPPDHRILVWVGRLHSMKRPLKTIQAFGQIQTPDLHLLMVGPDDDLTRQDCERYCSEHNVANVHLIGPVYGEKKNDYYLAADGYISLSHRENFNYTAAEALACGLPVILSPGNDLALELQKEKVGWMLTSETEQEAVEAMTEFARLPQLALSEMGLSAQKWARSAISRKTFTETVHQLASESIYSSSTKRL